MAARNMKTVRTGGITYLEPLAGTAEWYFGLDYEQGDLYEAEEIFRDGRKVNGRGLVLVHFPEGKAYRPLPKKEGHSCAEPVFLDGGIYIPDVDFSGGLIRILRFDCISRRMRTFMKLPLSAVRDCYNLKLHISPLSLTRQGGADGLFEIVWPERASFPMDPHESFFLRDGERLFFSRWHEEGDGADYRYWEDTVIRNLKGEILEVLPGDVRPMPDGTLWHLM